MKTLKFLFLLTIPMFFGCEKSNVNLNFNSNALGCHSFLVYQLNENRTTGIAVIGNRENLNLSETEQIFNLNEISTNDLRVEICTYNHDADSHYCSDYIIVDSEKLDTYTSVSGIVKVQIIKDIEENADFWHQYYFISVKIENIVLKNYEGKKIEISSMEFNNVMVNGIIG